MKTYWTTEHYPNAVPVEFYELVKALELQFNEGEELTKEEEKLLSTIPGVASDWLELRIKHGKNKKSRIKSLDQYDQNKG